jgi:hypothetical protein
MTGSGAADIAQRVTGRTRTLRVAASSSADLGNACRVCPSEQFTTGAVRAEVQRTRCAEL